MMCFQKKYRCHQNKKKCTIYRVDNCYQNQGSWNDNVTVAWETHKKHKASNHLCANTTNNNKSSTSHVPAKLKSIFHFEGKEQLYCNVHLCQFQSDKLSVLASMWMKEYKDVLGLKFELYKNMHIDYIIKGFNPIYRIIEAESIISHCLLISYHKESCYFILIKNSMQWSDEFYHIT